MKRIFAITTFALLLAGCATKNPILGRWVSDEKDDDGEKFEVIFLSDGVYFTRRGIYTISNNQIKLSDY